MTYRPSLAIALVVLGGTPSAGTEPAPPPAVDATLAVRLTAGKSTYAMGELIPLELEFRGRAGPDYFFYLYFSTGRMGHERYVVTPDGGADDPLPEYYSSVGVVGSGLSGWHPLDGTPFVFGVLLNEWVRFTKPGEYRLVVESSRLARYSREPAPTLSSSPVALHIETPTPEWASAEVARAVAALEGRGPGTAREGVAILRHLGTRDAALALVRLYGAGGTRLRSRLDRRPRRLAAPRGDRGGHGGAGRRRRAAPGRLRAGPGAPALLPRPSRRAPTPTGSSGRRPRSAITRGARSRPLGRGTPTTEALEAALAALEELLEPPCETSLPPLLGAHPAAAREAFLALPTADAGPAARAPLEQHRGALDPAGARGASTTGGEATLASPGWATLRSVASPRWTPRGAARWRSTRSGPVLDGLAPETLTSLLGESVPDLDEALRQRYRAARTEEGQAATMELIARYGSARLLPLVRVEIDRDPSCPLEAAALAYLLEHDPPPALRRLQPGFDRHRSGMCVVPPGRRSPRCTGTRPSRPRRSPTCRARVPASCRTPRRSSGRAGRRGPRAPLLERLARWNEEWRGRESELDALVAGPLAFDSPVVVENALVALSSTAVHSR